MCETKNNEEQEQEFELMIRRLNGIIREYGYYYISEIEIVGKPGRFETVTRHTRKLKLY